MALGLRHRLHPLPLDARPVSNRVDRVHLPGVRRQRGDGPAGLRPLRSGLGGTALFSASPLGKDRRPAGGGDADPVAVSPLFQPVRAKRYHHGLFGHGIAGACVAVPAGGPARLPVPVLGIARSHVRHQGDRLPRGGSFRSPAVRAGAAGDRAVGPGPGEAGPRGNAHGVLTAAGHFDPAPMGGHRRAGPGSPWTDLGQSRHSDRNERAQCGRQRGRGGSPGLGRQVPAATGGFRAVGSTRGRRRGGTRCPCLVVPPRTESPRYSIDSARPGFGRRGGGAVVVSPDLPIPVSGRRFDRGQWRGDGRRYSNGRRRRSGRRPGRGRMFGGRRRRSGGLSPMALGPGLRAIARACPCNHPLFGALNPVGQRPNRGGCRPARGREGGNGEQQPASQLRGGLGPAGGVVYRIRGVGSQVVGGRLAGLRGHFLLGLDSPFHHAVHQPGGNIHRVLARYGLLDRPAGRGPWRSALVLLLRRTIRLRAVARRLRTSGCRIFRTEGRRSGLAAGLLGRGNPFGVHDRQ